MSDEFLTLQEAADTLGVHYMTAYRYVRHGVLPASKVGGTWRVTVADLDAFRSGNGGATADSSPGESRRRKAPWAERLEARLVAGDGHGAWGVVEMALSSGASLDEVYLDVLTPAMQSIGERWVAGELDVSIEHRATGIAFRLIGRLGPRFARRGRTRGTVIIGAPAGERHSLPIALLADLLRGEGWEVSDLGADMPTDSFVRSALSTDDLSAVGVSVTHVDSLESAGELIGALREALAGTSVAIAVGGAAIRDAEHAQALGADWWAPSAREFAATLLRGGPASAADSA
ncbi:MAG: helix-turn-helix domain-containing protein [Ilumatobacteraceae bacterium]